MYTTEAEVRKKLQFTPRKKRTEIMPDKYQAIQNVSQKRLPMD